MQGQSRHELHVAGVPLISFQLEKKIASSSQATEIWPWLRMNHGFPVTLGPVWDLRVHMPVLVCRVDLLDNLRAHFQSHSVWLKSLSGVKFSITLKFRAAHLKLCAAISYLAIPLNKRISTPDVTADGWLNFLSLCVKSYSAPTFQKTSQTHFSFPFCFYLFVIYVLIYCIIFPLYSINHTQTLGSSKLHFQAFRHHKELKQTKVSLISSPPGALRFSAFLCVWKQR